MKTMHGKKRESTGKSAEDPVLFRPLQIPTVLWNRAYRYSNSQSQFCLFLIRIISPTLRTLFNYNSQMKIVYIYR